MRYRYDRFKPKREMRIAEFLLERCSFFLDERSIQPWFEHSLILVDSAPVTTPDQLIAKESTVTLKTPESWEPPVDKRYTVLFEDDSLLVVNKPGLLPVHPAGKYWFHTLSRLLVDDGHLDGSKVYPSHRLDRETSGIVIFAKDKRSASFIQSQFFDRSVKKRYVAVCQGVFDKASSRITSPLARIDNGSLRDVMVCSRSGSPAISEYEVLETSETGEYSLVALTPVTGRRHQLRAHLSSIGHPIVGDKMYGPLQGEYGRFIRDLQYYQDEIVTRLKARRHLLHCESIEFRHPDKGELMRLKAPYPEDMEQFCTQHRLSYQSVCRTSADRKRYSNRRPYKAL